MGFDKILNVKKYDFYIDIAFNSAKKKAKSLKLRGLPAERKKTLELTRIITVKDILEKQLRQIVRTFPSIDDLTEFYRELIKVTIGLVDLKKSIAAIDWARKKVNFFYRKYKKDIINAKNMDMMGNLRKQFYGRINSVLKQVRSDFIFLEEARKTLRKFPTIKSRFSIAIAGFPNVGKSTLLEKLTGARPEVASYAFTTKGLMLGTIIKDKLKIQLVDTPGTLNRLNKMNEVEMQAWLALKYVADIIIYIFDPTEAYPLPDQEKLLKRIKELDKPVIIYQSKTDIKELKLKQKYFTDYKLLKKEILKKAEKEILKAEKSIKE